MRCEEARPLIDGYIDGELDLVRNLEIERHLETCAECGPARHNAMELRSAIRARVPYYRASSALESRVRDAVRREAGRGVTEITPRSQRASASTWKWIGAAAAVTVFVLLSVLGGRALFGPSRQDLIAQQVLDDHVRSLMANHLTDVTSTDQHTVKPWFDGKLPFAPPVTDFAQQGFPLIGGRLEYLDRHPVAALVYGRRLHIINVFVWPTNSQPGAGAAAGADTQPVLRVRQGYNLIEWSRGGMTFWAASDLGADELQSFVTLLRQ